MDVAGPNSYHSSVNSVRGAKRSMPGKLRSRTCSTAVCTAGWTLNMWPTIFVYQGQPYSVSDALCTPTKPPPLRM